MKYDLLKSFANTPFFTVAGFKQILDADESESQRVREMLSRWVKSGHVVRLKKGVYMTHQFYEQHQGHPSFLPAVSAILSPLSYVSLEYILQHAGLLSEATYPITAVTLKNTHQISNIMGTFTYRHIRLPLYFGFNQDTFSGMIFNRATVAKALFDYFYFRPLPPGFQKHLFNLAEEIRLNLELLTSEMWAEFRSYIDASASPKMRFVLENLRRNKWLP